MEKFIVTGDLHFRSENPRSRKDIYQEALLTKLYEVVQIALDHKTHKIIIPGDVFDSSNVSLPTIGKLANFFKYCWEEHKIAFYAISGNHDLPAGNKSALPRAPFGLLTKLQFILDIENELIDLDWPIELTGYGFDYRTDTPEGCNQFLSGIYSDQPIIHVVHSMLLASAPTFPMRHTLIDDVQTDADIIISGHYHDGFGVIRRKDGKLFINPGSLCRLSASEREMKRTIQVAVLTVRSKTDFEAELIPLQSVRPAEEVLDREAIIEKKEHENWLENFFETLQEDGEAKFLEVREIVDSMAKMEKLSPSVKDEALRRISNAREKLGRVAV